jgi:hypothetical protein
VDRRKVDIVERARGLGTSSGAILMPRGLLMTSSSVTSAGLGLWISIRPKSRIHSNLVADAANDEQIVRNEQIGEAQFLLAGGDRYCGYGKEDEASAAMLYYQS